MLNKLIGVALIIAAFAVEVSWLAFCFGSVLIGILLLLFAPGILLAPFNILLTLGLAFLAKGTIRESEYGSYSYRSYNHGAGGGGYGHDRYEEPPVRVTILPRSKKHIRISRESSTRMQSKAKGSVKSSWCLQHRGCRRSMRHIKRSKRAGGDNASQLNY